MFWKEKNNIVNLLLYLLDPAFKINMFSFISWALISTKHMYLISSEAVSFHFAVASLCNLILPQVKVCSESKSQNICLPRYGIIRTCSVIAGGKWVFKNVSHCKNNSAHFFKRFCFRPWFCCCLCYSLNLALLYLTVMCDCQTACSHLFGQQGSNIS